MRAPVSWLREYVDVAEGVTGSDIAGSLVRLGLEEEGLHGGDVVGPLVVGRVLEFTEEPQRNGRTIRWCQVDVGDNGQRVSEGTPQGIVCGALNFAVGDLVVVVLPGGLLPGQDGAITARKTYGHVSNGMICSARELGLGEDHAGILLLQALLGDAAVDLKPGEDAVALLGLAAEVVEVTVTPDRGYCLSMRGIAREYSHATGAPFRDPAAAPARDAPAASSGGYPVVLDDRAPLGGTPGCDRYVARIVRGLAASAPTPHWMQRRLTQQGMRPISLAVDVTNYVMLTLGQPLHAFDLATLPGPVVVRRASEGERLTTLDGVERALYADDLLVTTSPDGGGRDDSDSSDSSDGSDSEEGEVGPAAAGFRRTGSPLAIAGVMGGATSEVTSATTDVLIEAAHFDPTSVARSSRRHKLSTEASRRFERGVDPDLPAAAAELAVELLTRFGGGTADGPVTDVDERRPREPIELDPELPTRLVCVAYTPEQVIGSLRAIGCDVHEPPTAPTVLRVLPPSWRPDLRTGPDLCEEVVRLHGYDAIPSLLPKATGGRGLSHAQRIRRVVADSLAQQGFVEVLTYPFVSSALADDLGLEPDDDRRNALRLANPLSEELPLMRTSVLSTLVDGLRRNLSRGQRDVALFEVGLVARPGLRGSLPAPVPGVDRRPDDATLQQIRDAVPPQPRRVALVLAGDADPAGWWGPGRPADWSDAVEVVQTVARAVGLTLSLTADVHAPWHPGRCARLSVGGHPAGSTEPPESAEPAGSTEPAVPTEPPESAEPGLLVGHAGELHPRVLARLGLPPRTCAAEFDLDVLIAASDRVIQAVPLSAYPVALSDVALVVEQGVPAADVTAALREGAGQLLESLELFDVYTGTQVGAGHKSLAYRLVLRAPDRTLTTGEVSRARDSAVELAAARTGARQRGTA